MVTVMADTDMMTMDTVDMDTVVTMMMATVHTGMTRTDMMHMVTIPTVMRLTPTS